MLLDGLNALPFHDPVLFDRFKAIIDLRAVGPHLGEESEDVCECGLFGCGHGLILDLSWSIVKVLCGVLSEPNAFKRHHFSIQVDKDVES